MYPEENGAREFILGTEVIVNEGFVDIGLIRYLHGTCSCDPLPREDLVGGGEDSLPCFCFFSFSDCINHLS